MMISIFFPDVIIFKVFPSGYDQLYTTHGFKNREVFPAVYALLTARIEAIYERFLQDIIALKPGMLPVLLVVDFELAAIRAFQDTFPTATVNGCMFYFGQCRRRLQSHGLSGRYRDEPDFALRTKCLLALAFVLPTDIIRVYESLIADLTYHDLDAVCDYMEDNFIGRERRGARGYPRFQIELWNQYSRVIANLQQQQQQLRGMA